MSEPQTYVSGWCVSHGRPDQYHDLCPRAFTTTFGVVWTCRCPNHANDETKEES